MDDFSIAIIGMSVKLPGADTLDEYWDLISKGKEAISFFTKEELMNQGVPKETLDRKDYVKASPILRDVSMFDAQFFNYSPKEAAIMDPQHRLWLEACWQALEDGGYALDQLEQSVGVFGSAGGNISSYFLSYLRENPDIIGKTGSTPQLGNDKDFLSTRVSYKLDLKGPSLTVQSACSSSLVAVHLACQSLMGGECDMALAGGASIRVPHVSGYMYEDGGILSKDGHCRAFDSNASGVVFGSGIGTVLLKPLQCAIKHKDHIYGVIKATAINNDGGQKISYTASSFQGQFRAISETLNMLELNPEEIGYLEAHGTGTKMGDPIEFSALSSAFHQYTQKPTYCAIGSVKSNIGHCEASAGIASLIKVALCLYHKKIPPAVNFDTPNPKINLAASPFYIPRKLQDWACNKPRKAAVNSLGMGGTNAFALLEEAPVKFMGGTRSEDFPCILTVSAKTPSALMAYILRYKEFLESIADADFSDVCYATNIARAHFNYRCAIIAQNRKDCIEQLVSIHDGEKGAEIHTNISNGPRSFQNNEPSGLVQLCTDYFNGIQVDWKAFHKGIQRKKVPLPTYPFERKRFWIEAASHTKNMGTKLAHRHVIEEVKTPRGRIFNIDLTLAAAPYLRDHKVNDKLILPLSTHIEIAQACGGAIFRNSPFEMRNLVIHRELVLDENKLYLCQVHIEKGANGSYTYELYTSTPQTPTTWVLYSSLTLWPVPGKAKSIESTYLEIKHKAHGVEKSIQDHYSAFEKAGLSFGDTFKRLSTLKILDGFSVGEIFPVGKEGSVQVTSPVLDNCLQVLGGLFNYKDQAENLFLPISIDAVQFHHLSPSPRLVSVGKLRYQPGPSLDHYVADVCVFNQENGLVATVEGICFKKASQNDSKAYQVRWDIAPKINDSKALKKEALTLRLDEGETSENLTALFLDKLKDSDAGVLPVILDCRLHHEIEQITPWTIEKTHQLISGKLLRILQTIIKQVEPNKIRLGVILSHIYKITDQDRTISLMQAPVIGLMNVFRREHPAIYCKTIDADEGTNPDTILQELFMNEAPYLVGYRQGERYVAQISEVPQTNDESPVSISSTGTYVVVGGTGEIGKKVVGWLRENGAQHIVVLSRKGAPRPSRQYEQKDDIHYKAVDISDYSALSAVFSEIISKMPEIKGIINLAGILDDGLMVNQSWERFWRVMKPKVAGSYNLHLLSAGLKLDFFLLFSSAAGFLGTLGQSSYAASNTFLDALMRYRRTLNLPALSICWGPWNIGMASKLEEDDVSLLRAQGLSFTNYSQGMAALKKLISPFYNQEVGFFAIDWAQFKKGSKANSTFAPLPIHPASKELQESMKPDEEGLTDINELVISEVSSALAVDVDDIDEDKPLVEIGLDSLMAVQIRNDLSKKLKKELSVTMFFEYPTLGQVLHYVTKVAA